MFPGASPMIVIRISPTSSCQTAAPATRSSKGRSHLLSLAPPPPPPPPFSGTLTFISSPETPELNYLQLAKITPLPEQETIIVIGCGQTEAASYSTPGIKTKTYSYNWVSKELSLRCWSSVTKSSQSSPEVTPLVWQGHSSTWEMASV